MDWELQRRQVHGTSSPLRLPSCYTRLFEGRLCIVLYSFLGSFFGFRIMLVSGQRSQKHQRTLLGAAFNQPQIGAKWINIPVLCPSWDTSKASSTPSPRWSPMEFPEPSAHSNNLVTNTTRVTNLSQFSWDCSSLALEVPHPRESLGLQQTGWLVILNPIYALTAFFLPFCISFLHSPLVLPGITSQIHN